MDTATLALLVTLSRVDGELRELDRQIQAGPDRLERLRQQSRRLQTELEATERDMQTTSTRRRDKETEAETLKTQIATYEQQLFAIKSNTDYQAMLRQIGETRARMTDLENQALELMEREEVLGARLEEERRRIRDQLDGKADEARELEQRLTELAAARRAKVADRERAVAALTGETRRLYDRIHQGKSGVAVVAVANGACGGCFSSLPPQRVNEARLGDRLVTCEACGRIVVWDEESSGS